MTHRLKCLLICVFIAASYACASQPLTTASIGTVSREAADLATLRSATQRFKSLDSAVASGYPREVAQCLVHEHHGAMGYHHLNRANLVHDIDISKPQILLYESMPDGSYQLNGVEFILPYRLWARDSVAPTLMGQQMHQEDNLKFWYLHVWAWRNNPGGVFANFHPDVTCPATTRKVYIPFPGEN
jgi:hypothetical protein